MKDEISQKVFDNLKESDFLKSIAFCNPLDKFHLVACGEVASVVTDLIIDKLGFDNKTNQFFEEHCVKYRKRNHWSWRGKKELCLNWEIPFYREISEKLYHHFLQENA